MTKFFYQINQNYLVVLMSSFFFEHLQLLLKPLYRKIKVTGLLSYVLTTNELLFQSNNRAAQGQNFSGQISQGKASDVPVYFDILSSTSAFSLCSDLSSC